MIHGMFDVLTSHTQARVSLETELLEKVRLAQNDWRKVPREEQDTARTCFMAALHAFSSVVLYR
jgi:hypothetical protein